MFFSRCSGRASVDAELLVHVGSDGVAAGRVCFVAADVVVEGIGPDKFDSAAIDFEANDDAFRPLAFIASAVASASFAICRRNSATAVSNELSYWLNRL